MTDHFYIHIPFCRQRCPYCKFALTPVFDKFKKRRYIEYLKKEITTYFDGCQAMNSVGFGSFLPLWGILSICQRSFREFFKCSRVGKTRKRDEYRYQNEPWKIWKAFVTFCQKVMGRTLAGQSRKTIYFGGGTPSVLSHDEIRDILECFPEQNPPASSVGIPPGQGGSPEITMEMNPEDVTSEYIEGIVKLGVNRISVGTQTLNEISLKEIHRSDRETIFRALESIGTEIHKSEKNISLNIDFILGLPFVEPGETLAGIQELHKKYPYMTHTSVYMLEDEKYPKHWRENSVTEDEIQAEFLEIMDYFESIGWYHYELSNWARPGYESVHNQAYWDHSETRGFGLSAASFEGGKRWSNASSFSGYYRDKKENEEILTPEQIEIEEMMFGLRRTGFRIKDGKYDIQSKKLQDNGLLTIHENHIKPTKTGIFVLDHILSELI